MNEQQPAKFSIVTIVCRKIVSAFLILFLWLSTASPTRAHDKCDSLANATTAGGVFWAPIAGFQVGYYLAKWIDESFISTSIVMLNPPTNITTAQYLQMCPQDEQLLFKPVWDGALTLVQKANDTSVAIANWRAAKQNYLSALASNDVSGAAQAFTQANALQSSAMATYLVYKDFYTNYSATLFNAGTLLEPGNIVSFPPSFTASYVTAAMQNILSNGPPSYEQQFFNLVGVPTNYVNAAGVLAPAYSEVNDLSPNPYLTPAVLSTPANLYFAIASAFGTDIRSNLDSFLPPDFTPLTVSFAGLSNAPLGNASVTVTNSTSTNKLTVSNLGSSGQDGVSILLGHGASGHVSFLPLDPAPVGAYVQFSAVGSIGGVANQSLGYLRVTEVSTNANGYEVTADLTPDGSATQRVEVWGNGVLLAVYTGHTGVVANVGSMPIGGGKLAITIGPPILGCFTGDFPPLTAIFVNGTYYAGDQIRVLQESGSGADYLSALNVTAANVDFIAITNETETHANVMFSGFLNTPAGQGDIYYDSVSSDLVISNLSSSGQDGVSISLGNAASCSIGIDTNKMTIGGSSTIPMLRFAATGSLGGVTNQSLGYVEVDYISSNTIPYQITANLTPEGSSTQRIEVWSQGQQMAVFTGHTGVVGTVSSWPIGFGKLGFNKFRLPCYRGNWPPFSDIFINGIHFVGDEILILQESGTTLDYLSGFTVTSAGINGLGLSSESTVVYQPTLLLTGTGSNMTLQWLGGGVLQSSTSLTQTNWSNVTGATSPYKLKASGPRMFFRVQQ